MARALKLLTGLSTVALSGALAFGGCAREGATGNDAAASARQAPVAASDQPGDMAMDHASHAATPAPGAAPVASGGESEGAALVDAAAEKSAFLSALQLVRGHLRAGVDLYALGDREYAPVHLRHPQAEIMTSLAPAFASHGATDFEPALDALATAGENGAPPAEINDRYRAALAAIGTASNAADASVKDKLLAVAKTLDVAGEEYSVAVKDDRIDNLHEYHDAYGFIAVALADLGAMTSMDAAEETAIASALAQVKIAQEVAPTVKPPAEGFKPASIIFGAAARIEIAANGL